MNERWWLDEKPVPADKIIKFEKTGEAYELHIDYYKALRRPVRVDQVSRQLESGESKQHFTVIDQEQILPDEGDAKEEPGLFLWLKPVE